MRESIGATFILSIVMTFVLLFTAYLAVSVNYARAFRVKNNLVSEIENFDGISINNNTQLLTHLENKLNAVGYGTRYDCSRTGVINEAAGANNEWEFVGPVGSYDVHNALACVYRREGTSDPVTMCEKAYYKVVVFFRMDLPVLGDLLTFNIKGDTRPIYDLVNDTDCIRELP